MTLCAWSTRSSGCAASTPCSASTTTSSGALMSFFMSSYLRFGLSVRSQSRLRTACGMSGLGVREVDARPGDLAVSGGTRDQAERVGGRDTGEQLGEDVDGELA